jgi:hypothetical protein
MMGAGPWEYFFSGGQFDTACKCAVVGRQARYGEHRTALRFLTGVKCFFSGVRFNPAIYRMPSQEARLSVSEVALFTIQDLTLFKSFTKASISA